MTVSPSTAPSTTITPRRNRPWACKSCKSIHGRRSGFGRIGRHRRLHQSGHQDRYASRVMQPRTSASRLPRSTIRPRSSSAARRPIGTSATTSGSGYNQAYRILDNTNGAGLMTPGGLFSGTRPVGTNSVTAFGSNQLLTVCHLRRRAPCQGVKPICPLSVGAEQVHVSRPRLLAVLQRLSAAAVACHRP